MATVQGFFFFLKDWHVNLFSNESCVCPRWLTAVLTMTLVFIKLENTLNSHFFHCSCASAGFCRWQNNSPCRISPDLCKPMTFSERRGAVWTEFHYTHYYTGCAWTRFLTSFLYSCLASAAWSEIFKAQEQIESWGVSGWDLRQAKWDVGGLILSRLRSPVPHLASRLQV